LPGEAVILDQHLIGSALPLAHQPVSGLQLKAYRGPSGLLQLYCDLTELALQLAGPA